jgi:pyruvate dehydrogenase (quinone)/pyruvate oxidase
VKFAEACGAHGVRIDDPRRCASQLQEALAKPGPAIIECVVDEHEPPMPATIKRHQAAHMYQALAEGTPNRKRIALTIVGDVLEETGFEASPVSAIPQPIGAAARKIVDTIMRREDGNS